MLAVTVARVGGDDRPSPPQKAGPTEAPAPTATGDAADDETEPAGEPSIYDVGGLAVVGCAGASPPATGSAGFRTVDDIAEDVEVLRGLNFSKEPEVRFMSAKALARHVERSSTGELHSEETRATVAALQTLRIIPAEFDIERFAKDAAGQILGLYEPRTERLLVADRGTLEPSDQLTVAHELDHALTDQALGFPDLTPQARRGDAQLAEHAVIEGDATVLMQHYGLRHFGDRVDELLNEGATDEQRRGFARTPYFLRRDAAFPYQEGTMFVCNVFTQGGWDAVDRLYAEPPRSTLEILFPGAQGSVRLREPSVPPGPGAGWTKALTSTLGAAELQWMFEAPAGVATLDQGEAARRVARWRGGGAHVWSRGDEIVVALTLREGADLTGENPEPLCHRLIQWGADSFPDARFIDGRGADGAWRFHGDVTLVRCQNRQVRYVVAPDFATAARVSGFE